MNEIKLTADILKLNKEVYFYVAQMVCNRNIPFVVGSNPTASFMNT